MIRVPGERDDTGTINMGSNNRSTGKEVSKRREIAAAAVNARSIVGSGRKDYLIGLWA